MKPNSVSFGLEGFCFSLSVNEERMTTTVKGNLISDERVTEEKSSETECN